MRTELLLMAAQAHVWEPLLRRILAPDGSGRSRVGSGSFTSGSVKLDLPVSLLRGGRGHASSTHPPPPRGGTTLMGTETLAYVSRRRRPRGATVGRQTQEQEHPATLLLTANSHARLSPRQQRAALTQHKCSVHVVKRSFVHLRRTGRRNNTKPFLALDGS